MTAHECLMHKWLAGDAAAARTATIEARRYEAMRNRLRDRYEVNILYILLNYSTITLMYFTLMFF